MEERFILHMTLICIFRST